MGFMRKQHGFIRPVLTAGGTATLCAAMALTTASPAHAQFIITQVMSGLNNPRHMTFGPDGNLYVTQAGVGGTGTTITDDSGASVSYGNTSSIAALNLTTNAQSTVFSGGPSLAPAGGAGATGIDDIAFVGNKAYGIIGFGTAGATRSNFNQGANAGLEGNAQYFAQLVQFSLDGTNTITPIADLGTYEDTVNPDGVEKNTNPFGLTALSSGGFVVTDAGGNSLLSVTSGGSISTLTTLAPQTNPEFPGVGGPTYEGVPTSVAVNPLNGNYYFTQLTGFPFVPGAANIYEYDPISHNTSIAYSGFTNLMDLTFDPSGNLYAVQYDTNGLASPSGPGSGQLIEIAANGTRTTLLNSGLLFPTSVAYGPDGALYITNNGTTPGSGAVLRLTAAAPEPGSLALLVLAGGLPILGRLRARRRRG